MTMIATTTMMAMVMRTSSSRWTAAESSGQRRIGGNGRQGRSAGMGRDRAQLRRAQRPRPTSRSAGSTPRTARWRSAWAAPTGSPASSPKGSGALLRRRRAGGRRALRKGGAADGDPRQGPHAGSGRGRARLQRRVDRGRRAITQRLARKVEFESLDFNRRFVATVPREYDPVALRELFSPGFLAWTTTMTGEIDFGVNDRQLWFLWHLRRALRGGAQGGPEERRAAVRATAA